MNYIMGGGKEPTVNLQRTTSTLHSKMRSYSDRKVENLFQPIKNWCSFAAEEARKSLSNTDSGVCTVNTRHGK